MTMKFYQHPMSSFCWKVSIALHEAGIPFESVTVNLGDPEVREDYLKISPFGKLPTLVDGGRVVNETSIIIEYLTLKYPEAAGLMPKDPEEALKIRALDRFYDLYINLGLLRIAGDNLRPEDKREPISIAMVLGDMKTALGIVERDLANRTFAAGETFTMADCSALPSLFYAQRLIPYEPDFPNIVRYLERLQKRPSVARVIKDAEPYFHLLPL